MGRRRYEGIYIHRLRRRELAGQSLEANPFGIKEFMEFCRSINAAPMLGVNTGTGTIQLRAADYKCDGQKLVQNPRA